MSLVKSEMVHEEHYDGDGRIKLGSVEEKCVRAATTLARNVLVRSCSVNNVVSHGILDDNIRPPYDGDIINIEITVYLNKYYGDTSETFIVGDVDEPGRDLV
ncbi:hypothetical protein K503DRAFT_785592 [Rhizopogon vinicolor AM-OR11-026]|uniref:Peptidase M24 domain-containing protein n=1 Tax=Rhizopogon vinicolor AM-OR11-026 TaxID=1314800 RepID=A0A1B7MPZ7_9AGAM|nr:hypothetical protein K503DRAFT_785592 [Rhizopogon vinicolor AM-OR11-026]